MRIIMGIFRVLVVVWLLADRGRVVAATPPSPVRWPPQAEGNALDIERAKQIALENARAEIIKYLRAQQPPIEHWQPSEDYVYSRLILGDGRPGQDVQTNGDTFKKWIVTLQRPDLDEFRRLDRKAYLEEEARAREQRRAGRVLLAAKALGLAMLCLGGLLIFVRVDEWSAGRHSRMLQLGLALSLLAAVFGVSRL